MTSSEPKKIGGGISEPYEVGTCPNCGKPLLARMVPFAGEIKIMCQCERDKLESERAERERYYRESKIRNLKERSGIPPLQKACVFDNFEQREGAKKAFNAAKRYVEVFENMDKGLILVGNTGSGKTHLAAAIGNALLDEAVSVKYIRAADLPRRLHRTYNNPLESEDDVLSPLENCRLLIIDDLGVDTSTDWKNSVWQSLIDYRINYMRPTIVTTNLTQTEMTARFDSRTIDRLYGCCHTITITAPSYRSK